AAGDALLDTKKLINRVNLLVNQTRGLWIGGMNPLDDPINTAQDPLYGLEEMMNQSDRTNYDNPPSLLSQPVQIPIQADWVIKGHIFIRQVDPIPANILEIMPMGYIE